MTEVEEFIKHHGVKGMKWGIRRYQPYPKGKKHKGKFLGKTRAKVKMKTKSTRRELSNLKKSRVSNMDKRSSEDLKKDTNRLSMENELKKLSSSKRVGTDKDREQYKRRDQMSDSELKRKVDRLRTKDNYKEQAQYANKQNIDRGKKVVTGVAKVVLPMVGGYAASKVSSQGVKRALKGMKLNPKDVDRIFNMVLK